MKRLTLMLSLIVLLGIESGCASTSHQSYLPAETYPSREASTKPKEKIGPSLLDFLLYTAALNAK